ncbi:MAG: hypothetical protein JO257_22460 [Deltaproteobacteria bacterium]|nr:hypothetical protein [Deltaproteobacteria bacterium]
MSRGHTNADQRIAACARVRDGEAIESVAAAYGVRVATVRSWMSFVQYELERRERERIRALWKPLAEWLVPEVDRVVRTREQLVSLCGLLEVRLAETRRLIEGDGAESLPEGVISLDEYRKRRRRAAPDHTAA